MVQPIGMKKRIVLTVTTDLVFDQRMQRICAALSGCGYAVLLVGRKKKKSPNLVECPYAQKRLVCFFEKGPAFYMEFNIRLFFFLLFTSCDALCGIDLDTALAAKWVSQVKRKPFVYDAHEYFTEMEELMDRPRIKKIWKLVEKQVFKNLKYGYTVSEGYVELYNKDYGVKLDLVRNVTLLRPLPEKNPESHIILYQGAVNVGRGLESLILAMQKIEAKLVICGQGDIYDELVELSLKEGLNQKVQFMGYVEPSRLLEFTRTATIGITLFEAKGLSNKYSMANRFFDYLHAAVPQLAMNYPEYKNFNAKYEVARLIDDLEPFTIASSLNHMLKDKNYYSRLKENAIKAREEVNWQNEKKTLWSVYDRVFNSL
jgi:glycosyltransferase involved in cell wall biosynthesis